MNGWALVGLAVGGLVVLDVLVVGVLLWVYAGEQKRQDRPEADAYFDAQVLRLMRGEKL